MAKKSESARPAVVLLAHYGSDAPTATTKALARRLRVWCRQCPNANVRQLQISPDPGAMGAEENPVLVLVTRHFAGDAGTASEANYALITLIRLLEEQRPRCCIVWSADDVESIRRFSQVELANQLFVAHLSVLSDPGTPPTAPSDPPIFTENAAALVYLKNWLSSESQPRLRKWIEAATDHGRRWNGGREGISSPEAEDSERNRQERAESVLLQAGRRWAYTLAGRSLSHHELSGPRTKRAYDLFLSLVARSHAPILLEQSIEEPPLQVSVHDHSDRGNRGREQQRERQNLKEVVRNICESSSVLEYVESFDGSDLPRPRLLFCHLSDASKADAELRSVLSSDNKRKGQVVFYTGAQSASLRELDRFIPVARLGGGSFAGIEKWAKDCQERRVSDLRNFMHLYSPTATAVAFLASAFLGAVDTGREALAGRVRDREASLQGFASGDWWQVASLSPGSQYDLSDHRSKVILENLDALMRTNLTVDTVRDFLRNLQDL